MTTRTPLRLGPPRLTNHGECIRTHVLHSPSQGNGNPNQYLRLFYFGTQPQCPECTCLYIPAPPSLHLLPGSSHSLNFLNTACSLSGKSRCPAVHASIPPLAPASKGALPHPRCAPVHWLSSKRRFPWEKGSRERLFLGVLQWTRIQEVGRGTPVSLFLAKSSLMGPLLVSWVTRLIAGALWRCSTKRSLGPLPLKTTGPLSAVTKAMSLQCGPVF